MRVRILTNSLASHDVPAVNSHYEALAPAARSKPGAELHEMRRRRRDPAATVVDTPPTKAEFMGLHTKAMVSRPRARASSAP
ncbi:MAG: hypothetical protein MZU95_10965 [Desulfomicrobium escambiense]|nr:hypothetical protein [Desulfomicrobium escambiense]